MNQSRVRWLLVLTLVGLAGCQDGERKSAERASQTPSMTPTIQATPALTAPGATPTTACSTATVVSAAPAVSPGSAVTDTTAKAPRPPAPRKAADLKVKRLVVAQGVEKREPIDSAATFKLAEIDRLYAFVEVENGSHEEGEVVVEFEPPGGGAPTGNVRLDVGSSPRWRTWAYTRAARKVGAWTAVVKTTDGEVLARTPFEVTL
jgi:hypothetical protein